MAEKDVDEQFAAIMAHWEEEALGLDPFGDPSDPSNVSSDRADPSEHSADRQDVEDLRNVPPEDPDHIPGDHVEEVPRQVEDAPSHGLPVFPSPKDPVPPRSEATGETGATCEARVSPPPPGAAPSEADAAAAPTGAVDDDEQTTPVRGSAWRRHDPAEVDEHFEPPPPAPLPSSEDKHFWTMVGALLGGPLLFLYLLFFNRDGNGWWMTFALLASVAGFVLLVLRQPNERDDDGVRL